MEAAEHSSGRYVRLADRVSRYYAPFVHIVALGHGGRLAACRRRLAHGADHGGRRADHHLPLRPRPRRAGGAGRRRRLPARPRHHGQGRRRARAPRRDRHGRLRQDRHPHRGRAAAGRRPGRRSPANGRWRPRSARPEPSSAGPRPRPRRGRDRGTGPSALDDVVEHPGEGMEGRLGDRDVRLGRRDFVGGVAEAAGSGREPRSGSASATRPPLRFAFEDTLRADAAETDRRTEGRPASTSSFSPATGPRPSPRVAAPAGIDEWRAGVRPAEKAAFLAELAAKGRRVLMVGDGLNDAPALATAFVSMSPASAADISQAAADIVFTGRRLAPVGGRPDGGAARPRASSARTSRWPSPIISSPCRSRSSASRRR